MNPYRSQYKDRSPFSSTAASALGMPSLSNINSKIKNNSFDFNKFYQTGLLEDYKNRISIHDSHWKEYATRLQSIKGREQAKARFAVQDAAGEANEKAGGLAGLTAVATAAAPLVLGAVFPGIGTALAAGLSTGAGMGLNFMNRA